LFEERVFELIGTLKKLSAPLEKTGVPNELGGGLAGFLHVENADCPHSSLTCDLDIVIDRADLQRVNAIAESRGFRFRHSEGIDMLLYGDTISARNAIQLLCSGEKQLKAHPGIFPVRTGLHPRADEVELLPGQSSRVCTRDRRRRQARLKRNFSAFALAKTHSGNR